MKLGSDKQSRHHNINGFDIKRTTTHTDIRIMKIYPIRTIYPAPSHDRGRYDRGRQQWHVFNIVILDQNRKRATKCNDDSSSNGPGQVGPRSKFRFIRKLWSSKWRIQSAPSGKSTNHFTSSFTNQCKYIENCTFQIKIGQFPSKISIFHRVIFDGKIREHLLNTHWNEKIKC